MVWTDAVSQDARRAARPLRALRRAGAARCTRPACWSPSGCGARTRGSGCAGPPSWPRRWARRPSWCTRRSPGSATTRATSPTGWPPSRTGSPGCASRWRTCTRCGWPGRQFVPYVPGLGSDRGRLRVVHAGSVALRGLAQRPAGDGRPDGRRPGPRAPRRRHRRGPRRAPGARAGHPALRASCSPRWPGAASPARWRWRSPPGARRAARCARPTCAAALEFARQHLTAPSPVDAWTPSGASDRGASAVQLTRLSQASRRPEVGCGGDRQPARRWRPACGPGARRRASGWRSAPSRTAGSSWTTCPGRRCRTARRRRPRTGRCRTRRARPTGPRPRRPGIRR